MVVHINKIGPVTFFRNSVSKSIKISVRPDKSVLISFPHYVRDKEVFSFLSRNESWIINQQNKIKAVQKIYEEGAVIHTKLHSVVIKQGNENGKVEVKENQVIIYISYFDAEQTNKLIENLLTKIYRHEAHVLLPKRLKELAQSHGFSYNKITIRNNKRNWGSCSSANNISLNLQMMKLPNELIDYILLHELVHTKIKNHSIRFWEELNLHTQNKARELSQQVKKYSTYTL
ncbi:MAG: SprT family zinc-dependent metalloprotease [Mariniphaga sp.]